jgi:tetratricopeptide (TPR) repeat protein
MMFPRGLSFPAVAILVALAGGLPACSKAEEQKTAPPPAPQSTKIPITTSSEDARKEFLAGRDISEKLQLTDSIQHFDKAISLDPKFALAELSRANVSPTGQEFFDHLAKAVSLSGAASNGERLLILATEAGANNNTPKQKEYLEQLETAYPGDERAHFNLGGYYFGQQEFSNAIQHYKKAVELNPGYSPVYNILGYAYRQNADYANAEQAFKKYIELIPNDPNPYDSYAELLLKMGKFDQSIEQYRKALSVDNNFVNSHSGIAAALMYQGKPADAAAELQKIAEKARNDGERRTSLFGLTVLSVDTGRLNDALAQVDQQYALGEKTKDVPAMAGDLALKGAILLEAGKPDDARTQFERSLKMTEASGLSQEVKANAQLLHHQNLALVSLAKKDFAAAKTHADAFQKGAEASRNPAQVRQAHGLTGRIALEQKDYDTAIAELGKGNQQDPAVLYRACLASEAKGEHAKSKGLCTSAADFNSLPQINYAQVRTKAKKMAERIRTSP